MGAAIAVSIYVFIGSLLAMNFVRSHTARSLPPRAKNGQFMRAK